MYTEKRVRLAWWRVLYAQASDLVYCLCRRRAVSSEHGDVLVQVTKRLGRRRREIVGMVSTGVLSWGEMAARTQMSVPRMRQLYESAARSVWYRMRFHGETMYPDRRRGGGDSGKAGRGAPRA